MNIIPAINCPNFSCVKERFILSAKFFEAVRVQEPWVQLDIADGSFTDGYATWQNPDELTSLAHSFLIEAHLMLETPGPVLEAWVAAGVRRLILPVESQIDLSEVARRMKEQHVEVFAALNPETKEDALTELLEEGSISGVQLLAVRAGRSGQVFNPIVLTKADALKEKYPELVIEVDGGITLPVAMQLKEASVDQVAVGSFLFNASDPVHAYQQLARQ